MITWFLRKHPSWRNWTDSSQPSSFRWDAWYRNNLLYNLCWSWSFCLPQAYSNLLFLLEDSLLWDKLRLCFLFSSAGGQVFKWTIKGAFSVCTGNRLRFATRKPNKNVSYKQPGESRGMKRGGLMRILQIKDVRLLLAGELSEFFGRVTLPCPPGQSVLRASLA